MILNEKEIGVKFVGGTIENDHVSPWAEQAEYGICYIYGNNPEQYVLDKTNKLDDSTGSVSQINYLEPIYEDLYIYVIYRSVYV